MPMELVEYQADDLAPVGTCLQGHVTATFDQIVERFGEPNILGEGLGSGDKVWWEWGVQFTKWDDALEDDEPIYATIYDWKETHPDHAHTGEYRWHIGGFNTEASWLVSEALSVEVDGATDAYNFHRTDK